MTGDLLDLILVVLVVAFAVAGYRQGFIIGVLSFAGFIGGGAVVSVISVLLIAWLIATAVAYAPFPLIYRQVNNSAVLMSCSTRY